MPKTLNKCFDDKLNYINLLNAYYRACKNKNNRCSVMKYNIDLETNLMNLYNKLKNNKYKHSKYKVFKIYEPKERIIKSLCFEDRIVDQWYVEEFIIPFFVPKFIDDSYACIRGRGTHRAVKKLQKYMRIMKRKYNNYYVIQFDIKKYFFNIDKCILFNILSKYIRDYKLLEFTKNIIMDNKLDKGIPIGNYTSQYFANIYLNSLDHYIKEELKIKYYIRYMDDFIILVKDKYESKIILDEVRKYLNVKLKLELNNKCRYYPNKLGIDFCGYKIYETHLLLRKRSVKKLKKIIKDYNFNLIDNEVFIKKYNSWNAHAKHANSFNLRFKYFSVVNNLTN